MPTHVLSNPQSFVREAKKQNIVYEYLIEAFECIGQQEVCKMFVGRSARGQEGTLSSGTLLNWKMTFEFIRNNPDHKDNEKYQARSIVKNGSSWDQYVELIKKPIPDDIVESWDNLSNKKLGDEAIKHGITYGVRNANAIKTLLDRMKIMVKRRKENIWDTMDDKDNQDEKVDFVEELRLKNVFELRELCAKRGIRHGGNTKKDEMIEALVRPNESQKEYDYNKMSSAELKRLAKERQLLRYNNLNKSALVELHMTYDIDVLKQQENELKLCNTDDLDVQTKEFTLIDTHGCTHPIIIRKDGMANATMLAKAYNKEVRFYLRNENTKAYIKALGDDLKCSYEDLVKVKQGGDPELQGTWVHHSIAIDMARWAYPPAAIQMDKWVKEYIITGTIQSRTPCNISFTMSDMDVEACNLELKYDWSKHSNTCVLYVAYIGDGLVKVGASDCRLLQRENKHCSSGTEFKQFRLLETFEISSICIEKIIHQLLQRFKVVYNKQKEIYKPSSTIEKFIEHVMLLLKENDLKMEILRVQKENIELKLENYKLNMLLNNYILHTNKPVDIILTTEK